MSPEAREFLEGVRHAEDPTPEDERRVLAAVHVALAASAGAATAAAASKAAATAGGKTSLAFVTGTSLKVGGAIVGLAAVAWFTVLRPLAHDAPPWPPSAPPSVRAADTPPPALPTAELPRVTAVPGAPPAAATTVHQRKAPSPVASTSNLGAEVAFLKEVAAAIDRGDGALALRRLDEHVTADRQLLAERKAARIRALCLVGRAAEARAAALAFRRAHPSSLQRDTVERSCAFRD